MIKCCDLKHFQKLLTRQIKIPVQKYHFNVGLLFKQLLITFFKEHKASIQIYLSQKKYITLNYSNIPTYI